MVRGRHDYGRDAVWKAVARIYMGRRSAAGSPSRPSRRGGGCGERLQHVGNALLQKSGQRREQTLAGTGMPTRTKKVLEKIADHSESPAFPVVEQHAEDVRLEVGLRRRER